MLPKVSLSIVPAKPTIHGSAPVPAAEIQRAASRASAMSSQQLDLGDEITEGKRDAADGPPRPQSSLYSVASQCKYAAGVRGGRADQASPVDPARPAGHRRQPARNGALAAPAEKTSSHILQHILPSAHQWPQLLRSARSPQTTRHGQLAAAIRVGFPANTLNAQPGDPLHQHGG